jgi:hypothetical protein
MGIGESSVWFGWEPGLILVGIAGDEPLLERLRVLVSEPTTDHQVKRKAVELFGSWSVNFRNERGMERLAGLRSQTMPKKVPDIKFCELTIETCCACCSTTNS